MVIRRSSADEIRRLLEAVRSGNPVARETATARLAVIGPRVIVHVEPLIRDATQPEPVRVALLQALEATHDSRALQIARAFLDAGPEALATAALGVVRAHASGDDPVAVEALDLLAQVALDPARPESLRAGALDALEATSGDLARPVRERLRHDPGVRATRPRAEAPDERTAAARDLESAALELPSRPEELRRLVQDDQAQAAASLPVLHRLIVRIRERERAGNEDERREWGVVRALVHQCLAERGSRVALYDLRETFERDGADLPVPLLTAMSLIGDASCVDALAAAWSRHADPWTREQLAEAFRRVRERERLTRRSAAVKRMAARWPKAAAAFGVKA